MNYYTYNELFGTSGNGIVTALKSTDETKFNEIFGAEYENGIADEFITFSIGESLLTKAVAEMYDNGNDAKTIAETLAKFLWLLHYNSWKALLQTLSVDYLNPKKTSETFDRTETNETSIKTTNETNSKVFAYNSETASDDSARNDNGTNDNNKSIHENYTKDYSGYDYGKNLFDILKQYKAYQIESAFMNVLKNDILDLCCINVY